MTDETLQRVSEMAAALMQPDEIAVLLDIDPESAVHLVKNKPNDSFTKAFRKGRLLTKLELRKKIIQLAKAGSPQAELLADKYLNNE